MTDTDPTFIDAAERAAKDERAIQRQVDGDGGAGARSAEQGAMQAGARDYPEPPMPRQHLDKPGRESISSCSPITMRRSTRAPASSRARWR